MSRMARIRLEGARMHEDAHPLILDLPLESDNYVRSRLPTFGWEGDLDGGDIYPFIIKETGKIDYGSTYEVEERYARTNLRDRAVIEGEYFTLTFEDEQRCYKVRTITWLDEL